MEAEEAQRWPIVLLLPKTLALQHFQERAFSQQAYLQQIRFSFAARESELRNPSDISGR